MENGTLKPQGLRLGNIIYRLGEDFNEGGRFLDGTKEIEIVGIETLQAMINGESSVYEGVPITQEWLLKLGYIRHDRGGVIQYEDDWDVCHEFSGDLFTYCVGGPLWKGLQFVHQLQNVVFYLTDKELEYLP